MDPRTSAQDVMRCDLCETAIVQMHCDTCLVNLCKACVGEHVSTDESKDHKVVKFQSRKSTSFHPGCDSHEKERCEMYCRHCDTPVCPTCLASDQHLGHKLSKILQFLGEKKDTIKKELTELTETIYPTYQGIAVDVQKRISQLEKEYGDLSSAITKHGDNLHREIDKLVNKLKKQVDEMKTSQLQTLQKHLDDINKNIVGIKDEIDSLEDVLDSNDSSSLFSVRSSVDQYEKLPQELVTAVPKFTPGTIQGKVLCHLFGALSSSSLKSEELDYSMRTRQESKEDAFSFIKVQQNSSDTGSHFPMKKLLDRPLISDINIFRNFSHFITLENVACLSNKKIWICGNGSTMSLCNINQFFSLKSTRKKSRNIPTDIAVTRNGNFIYTDHKARTVNIVKNEEIEEVIRLQNWRPRGVCSTSSDDLLVTMENDDHKQLKVVQYSDSTEKQSIQFDDKGRPLYSSDDSLRYICENRNFDICVSDIAAKAVVVVNQAGKLRFRYTGHTPTPASKQFSPRGITTDSQSHILTADFDNRCVHIIDQDGQFLHYIECTFIICGLCTDAEDNLYLAVRDSESWFSLSHLKEIKYLQ